MVKHVVEVKVSWGKTDNIKKKTFLIIGSFKVQYVAMYNTKNTFKIMNILTHVHHKT